MTANIFDKILRDARVKLNSMFMQNFREQGFFGDKWVATKASKVNSKGQKGAILIASSAMIKSIRAVVSGMAVVFSSHLPYTALHNDGGNFTVNVRAHSRTSRKSGNSHTVRGHPRKVSMPQRQFIGDHPKVQQALADIMFKNLCDFCKELADNFNRR